MRDRDDRVLAIMMKAPREGWVKTRLADAHPADRIVTLYRALVEDTIDLAERMRLRTVAVCPAGDESDLARWLPGQIEILPQQGRGLAAGLRSAFAELCGRSHDRVIAFNADSPHLRDGALDAAFAALADADLVVGPCDDGGYYLVGAKQPHEELFDAASMGRESACRALLGQASRLGLRVALCAEHYDVDVPADLARLARELSDDPSRAVRTAAVLASWKGG
jgi:rSAM/selenodomain-associated transferase 1